MSVVMHAAPFVVAVECNHPCFADVENGLPLVLYRESDVDPDVWDTDEAVLLTAVYMLELRAAARGFEMPRERWTLRRAEKRNRRIEGSVFVYYVLGWEA